MRVNRADLTTIIITAAAAAAGTRKYYFNRVKTLEGQPIFGLGLAVAADLVNGPDGLVTVPDATLRRFRVTLYVKDPASGVWGEWIKAVPATEFAPGWADKWFTMPGVEIDFTKSYVETQNMGTPPADMQLTFVAFWGNPSKAAAASQVAGMRPGIVAAEGIEITPNVNPNLSRVPLVETQLLRTKAISRIEMHSRGDVPLTTPNSYTVYTRSGVIAQTLTVLRLAAEQVEIVFPTTWLCTAGEDLPYRPKYNAKLSFNTVVDWAQSYFRFPVALNNPGANSFLYTVYYNR